MVYEIYIYPKSKNNFVRIFVMFSISYIFKVNKDNYFKLIIIIISFILYTVVLGFLRLSLYIIKKYEIIWHILKYQKSKKIEVWKKEKNRKGSEKIGNIGRKFKKIKNKFFYKLLNL